MRVALPLVIRTYACVPVKHPLLLLLLLVYLSRFGWMDTIFVCLSLPTYGCLSLEQLLLCGNGTERRTSFLPPFLLPLQFFPLTLSASAPRSRGVLLFSEVLSFP